MVFSSRCIDPSTYFISICDPFVLQVVKHPILLTKYLPLVLGQLSTFAE
jgi:hypothetical protein